MWVRWISAGPEVQGNILAWATDLSGWCKQHTQFQILVQAGIFFLWNMYLSFVFVYRNIIPPHWYQYMVVCIFVSILLRMYSCSRWLISISTNISDICDPTGRLYLCCVWSSFVWWLFQSHFSVTAVVGNLQGSHLAWCWANSAVIW